MDIASIVGIVVCFLLVIYGIVGNSLDFSTAATFIDFQSEEAIFKHDFFSIIGQMLNVVLTRCFRAACLLAFCSISQSYLRFSFETPSMSFTF